MPELPEVSALASFLERHAVGRTVARAEVVSFPCLKSAAIPLSALLGMPVEAVTRRGKHLCLDIGGLWLVIHLAHAGWLTWREDMPLTPGRPSRGPLAFRLVLDNGTGFDVTEAGTVKSLAIHLVAALADVPRIATLGPEPLDPAFTPARLGEILDRAGGAHVKSVLRDQRVIAGIGNAYSDEIAWAARLSPFAAAGRLAPEQRARLYAAIRDTLTTAITALTSIDTTALKPVKQDGFAVHARTGEPCPACGTTIAEVSYADSALQYCPTCQTRGTVLADRRLSRLLK